MKFFSLMFFGILLTTPALNCRAADLSRAACGTIPLAYYENGALYYRNADGSYAGIDKDVVEEVARRTGCHFNTVLESRIRIWTQLNNGTLAMSVSGIATPEREKAARFIPYFATRNYALLHKDAPLSAQTMEGFLADPKLQIAIVKSFRHGDLYDEWISKLRAQNRVHEGPDFESVMRLFAIRRVDAVLALPTGWQPLLKRENLLGKVQIKDWSPHDRVVASLILSRTLVDQDQYQLIEKAIISMREDGSLEQIFKRHVGPEIARELRYSEK
ncbi:substrate-binding periplasmic protein [Undibacterium sp. Ren11W]|uniref:substrate-binding periplasmic protein n=1 Tax=Undibacterium sp. Ren11W TaxID=3413045 RepID=UPI003BF04350